VKTRCHIPVLVICVGLQNLFLCTAIFAAGHEKTSDSLVRGQSDSSRYLKKLKRYAEYAEVVSGGFYNGNRVRIHIGGHTFYDNVPDSIATAGLYVVAVYNNKVLLQRRYNTFNTQGAGEGLARDISGLPRNTFVIVASKDESTRLFDKRGQYALYSIGAEKGLLGQKFRTSYLCIGMKGLAKGGAIEKVGMEELRYTGSKVGEHIEFTFQKKPEPRISKKSGKHEGLMIGDTEVIYYIPKNFKPKTAEYIFCIHGAGDWHRPGALTHIAQFKEVAERDNLVVIAPAFDCILNWRVEWPKDFDKNGKFKEPRVIKDWNLWGFLALVNGHNEHRTDLKLLEIFEFFNRRLMKRDKFHLYGHSGGGQFVSRFITFYPELIDKVAVSSAGSFLFPRCDMDYPYGLKMANLEKTFGAQVMANDLKLTDSQFERKINHLLDLRLFIIVGGNETEHDPTDRAWQGRSTLDKARNYYEVMKKEDQRLKNKGIRPESSSFQFELHIMPGIGHHAGASGIKAKELLFPANKKTGRARASEPCTPSTAAKGKTTAAPEHPYKSLGKYADTLEKYAGYTEVISGGYHHGNKVTIRVGDHTFYDNVPDGPDRAGLYVIAIFEDEVLLRYHYNTYNSPGSCEWLMSDFQKLPQGTFVVIAAKDEPTNYFNETGQKVLYQIGAGRGLLDRKFRTSYLCIGVKGLARGDAIEKMGMEQLRFIGSDAGRHIELTYHKEPRLKSDFFKIYDPGTKRKVTRSVNDHCFMRDKNGKWHMFGILLTEPYKPISGRVFVHAVADSLTQVPWSNKPFALKVDPKSNEVHLWAPHIIFYDGLYYMYYCAGDTDRTKYKIHLAVSKNLKRWKHHPENPMIVDGFDARDPFILKVGDDWVMYYTATSSPTGGNHIVACQTSKDLIHWQNRKVVFRDTAEGKGAGPTESPTIIRRGEYYYLFIGPRNEYAGTDIFRSRDPFKWEIDDRVGHIHSHAAEIIRDVDGEWHISHCGKGQGGLYLAPLEWNDGLDDTEASILIPKESR